jgi:hypothetical protein
MAKISLELDDDEALVLFEFLHRWESDGNLEITDPSEGYALERLQGALESTLVGIVGPDYDALLETARKGLRERAGAG